MATPKDICTLAPELINKLEEMRMSKKKTLCAMLMKVNRKTHTVEFEEEFEDITIEDLVEELPHQQPRYLVLTYPLKHSDGRVSYKMVFVYICPLGCNPEQQMLYAGTKLIVEKQSMCTKSVEYRSVEEMTDESIRQTILGR